MITQEELQRRIEYNPETGLWKRRPGFRMGNTKPDWFQGHANKECYLVIMVNRKLYFAHRLAWLYIYGEFPPGPMDHLNGDKTDNRIENLRVITQSLNSFSVGPKRNNTSGITGVRFQSANRKKPWRAEIKHKGVRAIKFFETKEGAAEWRKAKELEFFHELSSREGKGPDSTSGFAYQTVGLPKNTY